MERILCLLHTQSDGTLSQLALETLTVSSTTAAQLPDAVLLVGILGTATQQAATQIGSCGANQFFIAEDPALEKGSYHNDTNAAEAIAKAAQATIIFAPADSRFNRMISGMAIRLNGRADTHAVAVAADNGTLTISRWYYRQRIIAQQTRQQRPWVISIESDTAAPWKGDSKTVDATTVSFAVDANTKVIGTIAPENTVQTIKPDSPLLFVAGAGWCKKQSDGQTHLLEAESLILDFVNRSGASLGSSKSLVDQNSEGEAVLGCLTHMNQVGQTGSTPRHPKGLATCCHGEEPHTVGWRFITQRRAINTDANCGWARGKTDVLYVADAFKVMKILNDLLK
ncbi:electron transfer flavoprotein subunit alpha [Candidatus Sumerlaeota bacterium]|nr:electron transfer flavoprotein subunit alpha [Candidatus Sumerlaeota bacterium]